MTKKIFFSVCLLWCFFSKPVSIYAQVTVKFGETYMCGDSFEISFPDQISTSSLLSRNLPNLDPAKFSIVQAEAGKRDKLLLIRVKIRNLTPTVYYRGLNRNSYKLTGYVRNHYIS